MPSLTSRHYRASTTTTTDTLSTWDPEDVLQLYSDSCCVGYAPSRKRKCLMRIRRENAMAVDSILEEMRQQQPDAKTLRPTLVRLAQHGLCVRFHQYQVEDMVEKWSTRIIAAYPPPRGPSRNLAARHEEVATLQERLREMERQIDLLEAATQPSPSISRVSTSDISSLHLSRTSTAASGTTFNNCAVTTTPARRIPSPISQTVRTTTSTSPESRLASSTSSRQSSERYSISTTRAVEPTALITQPPFPLTPMRLDAQVSPPTPRAIVPSSPDLSSAPLTRSILPINRCTRTHARRLPYNDECPICYDGADLFDLDASELVWCRSSCGRTVHKSCFDNWRSECEDTERSLDCPVCRADWEDDCDCLGCAIKHVKRRAVEGDCAICCHRMSCNDEADEEVNEDEDNDAEEHEDEAEEDEDAKLVWCKVGCGQSVHKNCFETWKKECEGRRRTATCVNCRTQWKDECEC